MTKDAFHALFGDELRGLLLAAFEQDSKTIGDMSAKGLAMRQQMMRGKNLLDRIYEALTAAPVGTNGPLARKT